MVRTRFAPSPTGYLHIGGARTALFAWAFARRHQGTFILRIEDTDLERSTPESVQAILDGMQWLGLDYDEGPFYQMQRMPRYREVLQKLIQENQAYYCYCSKEDLESRREAQRAAGLKPRYDGRCRNLDRAPKPQEAPIIRFKNPLDGKVVIDDLIKGRVVVDNTELDDLVIARADGTPTYNFCVVVDDYDMQITHVIRGDDHLNNTPRQINILKALGATLPLYAHVPMILGPDGERLSKRHGAVSVMQYKEAGFLPEALLNYLARLGWAHGDAEVFSLQELTAWFDLEDVHKSPAKFDPEKLAWINHEWIKATHDESLAELLTPFLPKAYSLQRPSLVKVVALLKARARSLVELSQAARMFYDPVQPDSALVSRHLSPEALAYVRELRPQLAAGGWQRDELKATLKAFVKTKQLGFAAIAMPLRVMITGGEDSPSIDAVLEILGQEESMQRLDRFLKL